MERKRNSDVVLELLDLAGKRVLDVGCGEGHLVRLMTREGARVTGLECGEIALAKALAAEPAGDETYVEGRAEDLPFEDRSMDIVVFFNSLHHVPTASQRTALEEAARVVKPGGLVYIAEPLAEGSHFEAGRPIEDETEVRAAAYRAIKGAGDLGLVEERETVYLHTIRHESFEAFRDFKITVDEERASAFAAREAETRAAFERWGRKTEGGWEFDQPMRVTLLGKAG